MQLSALMDFPDDARQIYYESTMYAAMKRLGEAGVSRVYLQYYGNRDYGHFWTHKAPTHREMVKTAENLPEYSRVFVEAAKANGMETAVVMRPQEQGMWQTFSPYYKEARKYPGIPYTGGNHMIASNFVMENPELRIKRRTWDLDPDAVDKEVASIKLYKQNAVHSRIGKPNITIYVSKDNSYYEKYDGLFSAEYSVGKAVKNVITGSFSENYPTEIITSKGDSIEIITLGGLSIKEKYIAVAVTCDGDISEEAEFTNTPMNMISIHGEDGKAICSSPGWASRFLPKDIPYLDGGFHFDDGFGEHFPVTLDRGGETGYIAVAKGRDEYVHGALCECEPKVRAYWNKWLEKAMDDGFDMAGHRIECHSVHVDEPFAYGYNDCIKDEYFKRYGKCDEKDMSLGLISIIRGDAYTDMLREAAMRTRTRRRKVILTLNLEMLYDPLPVARYMAYPMNVEWQWERWLEEIRPDEINIRTYQMSPGFILKDEQCRKKIDKARSYGVPMTLERYDYWDFAAEFEMVRDTGIFSRMTLYETNNIIQSDGKGGIVEIKPDLLKRLAELTGVKSPRG